MIARRTTTACALAVACFGAAQPAERQGRALVPLEWKRAPGASAHREEPVAPPAPEPPAELSIAHVDAAAGARGKPEGHGGDLETFAHRAGDEMAREAEEWGRRACWRAGFARGVSAAFHDPRVAAWDREEGRRFGRSDPRVRVIGDQIAHQAAEDAAERDAAGRVQAQFMDLSRDPERDSEGGGNDRGPIPGFAGPFAVAPVMNDVFVAYPLSRTPGLSSDSRRAMEGWRVDPAVLARDDRGAHVYDGGFKDPSYAFETWKGRQGRGSYWARLQGPDRDRFREAFRDRFARALAALDSRFTREAWRRGFEDGWRYGAAVAAESAYRQGYAEGFDAGVAETASIAYPYVYGRAYDAAYLRSFDDWSRTPHPGVGKVRIVDESGDGIFEPGEPFLIDAEVVNYGGGSGVFELVASGAVCGPPVRTSLRPLGRGRVGGLERLTLRVNDDVPPRTRTTVDVTIAGAGATAPLYVSRPLEIDGAPTIDADRIDGRVTVGVAVINASRRDARASVRVTSSAVEGGALSDEVGVIPAGGRKRASVTFQGIHPLDLIGAESRYNASVSRDGTVNDTGEVRLPQVATDLSNPDLMDFTIALARAQDVSRSDVKDTRELMLDRLRADWARAVSVSGNPYKHDYETEGVQTVLGQLVRVTQGGGRSFASPQVFDGLEGDVAALADDLPGPHPMLRKWMKKLAGRLR